MQLSKHISTIASEFEKKIKELNGTFRSHYEELLNKPMENDDENNDSIIIIPDIVKIKLQTQIHDFYLYTLNNYGKIPENKRIEIKYYSPSSDDYQEMLIYSNYVRFCTLFKIIRRLWTDYRSRYSKIWELYS